ncbi:MAG TPA: acyl carrier protein [Candidatus Limnocylindrales bacterium]|nr:acyl carrier protein [Candidatus Limnocylindrales bacterium]
MIGRRKIQTLPAGPVTEQALRAYLSGFIALRLGISEQDVEQDRSFESYGLDSRTSVQASGDLEDALSLRLEPGLLYEYPTIEALAAHLAMELEETHR